jgi:hypothetical protein
MRRREFIAGLGGVAAASAKPSFTLVAVEVGGVPKVIEVVLHAPADVPATRSEFVEPFEVGGALGRW